MKATYSLVLTLSALLLTTAAASAAPSTDTSTPSRPAASAPILRGNPAPDVQGAIQALKNAANALANEEQARLAQQARRIANDLRKNKINAQQAQAELQKLIQAATNAGVGTTAQGLLQQAMQCLMRLDA